MATVDIPRQQKAAVKVGEGVDAKAPVQQVDVQSPGPTEVLVKINWTGLCASDKSLIHDEWAAFGVAMQPATKGIAGHEGAGVVVARGELVKDVKIGEKVGIKWLNGSCLSCSYCQNADESLCAEALLSGYTVDGSFQQYAVAKAIHVARIPEECDLEAISPILCAGITVYKGIKESGVKAGQSLAIVGAGGGLGSIAVQYAKAMGIHAIAIDGGEEKEKLCLSLGAQSFIDFTKTQNIVADVKATTSDGLGPHAALLVAAAEKPFQQATQYIRSKGTVVCIGLPAGAQFSAPVFDTVVRMIQIKGSYVGNRADTAEAIDFYRRGLIKVPFKTVGLSELNDVFKLMKAGQVVGRYVVDTSR